MAFEVLRDIGVGFYVPKSTELGLFAINRPFQVRPLSPLDWLQRALHNWFRHMGWNAGSDAVRAIQAADLTLAGTLSRQTFDGWLSGSKPQADPFEEMLRIGRILTQQKRPILDDLHGTCTNWHRGWVFCLVCADYEPDVFARYGWTEVWDAYGAYLELVAAWAVVKMTTGRRVFIPFHERELVALLPRIGVDGLALARVMQCAQLVDHYFWIERSADVWGPIGHPELDPPALVGAPLLDETASAADWRRLQRRRQAAMYRK